MKYTPYLMILLSSLLLVGCTTEMTKKEEELKSAVEAELDANNNKIKDINGIIDFVNETDTNQMMDQKGEPLRVFENYEINYLDFTGEGNEDVAIVTWEEDNYYLPVIFVTTDISNNEYSLINSDFYASEGEKFFCEGKFIIKEDTKNKSYDIAYNLDNEFIHTSTRYVNYGEITQILQPEIGIKYIINNSLEKVDSFNRFNVNSTYTYGDEMGTLHKYEDITRSFSLNEENKEYEIVETQNMESISLGELIFENFVVGTDKSLKTFETVYQQSDLETAIDYYYEHRRQFDKNSRVSYIEAYQTLITGIYSEVNESIEIIDEVIKDGIISEVTVDMAPLPDKVDSVFSIVKQFYVEDGTGMDYRTIDETSWYTVTCINKDIKEKIRLMYFDQDILANGEKEYQRSVDGYVDTEFSTQEQMLKDIRPITYPTVLINNLSQIDEFEHRDIWKTNIVIIPENINYN